MPPHAETNMLVDQDEAPAVTPKNVTFAINYEVSLVDEFVASPHRQRRVMNPGPAVESVPESTASRNLIINCTNTPSHSNDATTDGTSLSSTTNSENSAPNSSDEDASSDNNNNNNNNSRRRQRPALMSQSSDITRRSARDKQGKRDVSLARTRVRYDMQIVPPAHRNKAFLNLFPPWWMTSSSSPSECNHQPRRKTSSTSSSSSSPPEYPACNTCVPPSLPPPFSEDTSVVWIPTKRTEWEDSVSEMTAVCTSAALHRHVASLRQARSTATSATTLSAKKPFHAPLSRDYIRDRVDIDDPLLGYQIRHKTGGWLQGFCLWTNFTTWTHYFKWDSLHEQSGMAACKARNPSAKVDRDGSLAQELEAVPREGDPMGGGIVFSSIAEIGLVGALGCGEYLLRMALDGIREKKQYRFVVLQATDSSKAFYERFGFVRVGAICRYYVGTNAAGGEEQQPIVGYRHWTHANESDASLQMHGGPSYMMCLKLPPIDSPDVCARCERPASARTKPSFLQAMLSLGVDEKPTIEQLGGTSTPSLCRATQRRNSKISSSSSTTDRAPSNVAKKKAARAQQQLLAAPQRSAAAAAPIRRKPSPNVPARTVVKPIALPPTRTTKRRLSSRSSSFSSELPPAKKSKPSGTVENTPREVLFSPPAKGKAMSYAQKQYQSVWLAVPPDTAVLNKDSSSSKSSRPPPKLRCLPETTAITGTQATASKRAAPGAIRTTQAAKQAPTATSSVSSSKPSPVESKPSVASTAKKVPLPLDETTKPPAREMPKRAAAIAAAAAVTASAAGDGPKKAEKTTIASSMDMPSSCKREVPKKSADKTTKSSSVRDATKRIPTAPTRELPKRAAAMPKPLPPPPAKDTRRKTTVRARSKSKKTPKPTKKEERLFYSVRGPDGRFVRVPIGSTITYTASVKSSSKSTSQTTTKTKPRSPPPASRTLTSVKTSKSTSTSKKSTTTTSVKVKRADRSKPTTSVTSVKVKRVDRAQLRKQKVHSYPRSRPHFYNRVVKPADGTRDYFFVLNYNEDSEQIRLVPMEAKNKLTGQREGRPRYQCVVGDTDANFVTVSAKDYQVVPATMVMKTPFVAYEAWDIEDED